MQCNEVENCIIFFFFTVTSMTSNIRCNSCSTIAVANDVRTQFHFLNVLQSAARKKALQIEKEIFAF